MSDEKRPVLVLDLQLSGWERRNGPYRRVLMTRDEFVSEVRKVEQRLGVVQKLLAAGDGLTNRERRALDKEQRILTKWLRNVLYLVILDNPSWASDAELRMAKVWSGGRHSKARSKKERWLVRKHPSWLSDAELKTHLWLMKHAEKVFD
jgi:hypothetical protein